MKRYLFLKLGLTILVFAAASPRNQVTENYTSRDAYKQSNQNSDQVSSSQQSDQKGKSEEYQGVMGKPGVDFPILTYIPRTGFTCKGKKSGYYADLDTNCQVFHICEEGRKVSFLCPNGTIFQQSDLICDWWFKVDCATAPTLYDESAEQLYEENIRRKENRRVLEQERRQSKIHRQQQRTNNQNNFVKKDTNQYVSHNYHSREDTYKETQIPSETASFVNNRYSTEQQKKYFKSINDVSDDAQSYISTNDYTSNSYKSTTEKIVSRGSRTYSTTNKIQYRNQLPDIIKTTTQHTIYSPTVPPFTTRYTTRYTTKSPTTISPTTKLPTTPYKLQTTRKPVTGFYITKGTTFAPEIYTTPAPVSAKLVASTPAPFSTTYSTYNTYSAYSTDNTYSTDRADSTYSTDSTVVDTTEHPLIGSGLITRNNELENRFLAETTETYVNTASPSVPTPFKSQNKNEYLPKLNASIPTPKPTIPTEYTTLNAVPTVTENLNNMIKTLEDIDKDPEINIENKFGSRAGLNIPPSAGPKTLHSLAIYFATALDNLVTSNENDTANNEELTTTVSTLSTVDDTQVTLLSRTTQNKYNTLFDLEDNNHTTTEHSETTKPDLDLRSLVEHDAHFNDLDSQQSRGPVSSTPRIRQLAQVFTQALSAYLDDPDTFKKVLEEIRPTEPPLLAESLEISETAHTTLPSTTEYKSYTKEEDEVLDFSDADKSSTYRPFNENIRTTEPTVFVRSTTESYTTNPPEETTKLVTKSIPTPNSLALVLNNGLKLSNSSVLQELELDESSTEDATESDDYFPFNTGDDDEDAKIRATAKPYGLGVKPENSTPISIPLTTTNSWIADLQFNSTQEPADSLLPPLRISLLNKKEYNSTINLNDEYLQSAHSQSFVSHNSINDRTGKQFNFNNIISTTDYPETTTYYTTTPQQESTTYNTETTTRYDESTTETPSTTQEPFVTTQTTTFIPPEISTLETTTDLTTTTLSKAVPNNHWSTSPEVTKLWESTLYVDPQIINRNLGDIDINTPTTYRPEYSTLPYRTTTEDYIDEEIVDLRFASTTDEPTTTTVTVPTTEINIYTTVIDLGIHSLLNSTELEIASSQAQQIFGNLKSTEQDILIEKMKEAESNSTVRRLILLLVSTCDASLSNNKTVQQTRNSILHALLNLPTNVPEKVETHNRNAKQLHIETTTNIPETTTEEIQKIVEIPNKTNDIKDVNQDTRALELLRSLYSLAAKWGKK